MAENWTYKTAGIPDELFNQNDDVPGPTMEEVRALVISKARLCESSVVIDVGCGTGDLTIEAALQVSPKGKVYAIDESQAAIVLTMSNVEKFGVQDNVVIVRGKASETLLSLPKADVVLVNESGSLREVLDASKDKLKPNGRIVVNAIHLETAGTAVDELKKLSFKDIDVALISVAKGKQVSSGTTMIARNPIIIVSASRR